VVPLAAKVSLLRLLVIANKQLIPAKMTQQAVAAVDTMTGGAAVLLAACPPPVKE
jgi:hypothetical protein